MAWFFQVTYYDNTPCASEWVGPFDDEASALAEKAQRETRQNTALGRQDTFTAPAEMADPRPPAPSPVVMIVSRWNSETESYEDWEIHADGTENKRA